MIRRTLLQSLAAGTAAAALRGAPALHAQTAPAGPGGAVAAGGGWSVPVLAVESPSGIKAWLIEDRSVPVVALRFAWREAGAGTDPAGREGRATFAAGTLDEGAGPYPAAAFQAALDDRAVSLSFSAGRETFSGSLRTLASETGFAADMLALALTRPRFDAEALERVRASLRTRVIRSRENPRSVASRAWWEQAFPGHPFGRDASGTEAGLAALTAEELRGFVAERLRRGELLVGAAGAISAAALGTLLDRAFGGLAAGAGAALPPPPPPRPFGTVVEERPNPQSVAIFGQRGLPLDDPDFVPALAVNRVLAGGGFSSRLTEEVRERRGLAYSVGAQIVPLGRETLVLGSVATENARMAESLRLIRAEWQRMAEGGPSTTELADAKAYLTGSFPLEFTSTPRIADMLLDLQISRRPIDWLATRNRRIAAVTPETALRAARRLYDAAALATVVVGRPVGVRTTPG